MDLSTFYALMSVTCFTLVGLWWTAIEKHDEWRTNRRLRRLAGGTYLSFLLPGVMSMMSQVNPDNPLMWRISFGLTSIVGLVTSVRLVRVESGGHTGPFRRFRWLAPLLYALIVVLGIFPELAGVLGAAPLQVASVLLMLLILLAHGFTWEFLMEPDEAKRPREPA
jgi:cytochrome bd-type quinol oxidase subunit 2